MAQKHVPIKQWSHSSLMAYLRNPLAWYKRYVEHVYDTPASGATVVGRAGHIALQHFYGGLSKSASVDMGLSYLRDVPDFEIDFGKRTSKQAKKAKRVAMEREYLQAIGFYLARPPRYEVLGVEVKATAQVPHLLLPITAVSDLVVVSKEDPEAVDIVDHKFVASFSPLGRDKTLFIVQALFNYYTVSAEYKKPVKRFIFQECKKTKNANGRAQMKKHIIYFDECKDAFAFFARLINDATEDLANRKVFLPNPSDMFEGEDSVLLYKLRLVES